MIHAPAAAPRACVLLCGPIGGARERAHRTLVEVARALVNEGFGAMRFDFRGMGESGPGFERFTMTDWRADIAACAEHLRGLFPDSPVLLVGVQAGAVLASECFRDGVGDAAVFASPLVDGSAMLRDILRRQLMADMMAHPNSPRVQREEIVAALLRGAAYNIDGYFWTRGLWVDAAAHVLALPDPGEARPWWVADFAGLSRTVMVADTEPHRVSLQADRFWEPSAYLVPRETVFRDFVLGCARETAGRRRAA
ncbi:MAG: alpha/beta hydrolase [Phycisphaerales bacterium]|nr:alpha/beta hydrolase [Phycisphaerales bacterium]